MTHVSLFTGIGGLDLAAEAAGFETVLQVEREPYPLHILERHWPDVPRITDIREVTSESVKGHVTVVSGGFPCQPFSSAGKRRGTDDNRYLWPEMLRVIRELSPAYVVAENVSGLLSLDGGVVFETVCTDLESDDTGYEVIPLHYPAAGVGAPHKRDRIFIVGHAKGWHRNGAELHTKECLERKQVDKQSGNTGVPPTMANADFIGSPQQKTNGELERERFSQSSIENRDGREADRKPQSSLGGMAHGLPDWVDGEPADIPRVTPRVTTGIKDRVARLKALGNAVVPAQAYPIFAAIAAAEGRK